MSEPKLLIKAELVDNKVRVTLGTRNELFLIMASRKMELYINDILMENEIKMAEADKSPIVQPNSEVVSSILEQL